MPTTIHLHIYIYIRKKNYLYKFFLHKYIPTTNKKKNRKKKRIRLQKNPLTLLKKKKCVFFFFHFYFSVSVLISVITEGWIFFFLLSFQYKNITLCMRIAPVCVAMCLLCGVYECECNLIEYLYLYIDSIYILQAQHA